MAELALLLPLHVTSMSERPMFRLQAGQISVVSTYAWGAVSLLPFIFCNDLHLAYFDLLVHYTAFTITLQRQMISTKWKPVKKAEQFHVSGCFSAQNYFGVVASKYLKSLRAAVVSLKHFLIWSSLHPQQKNPIRLRNAVFTILRNCTASLSISKNYFPLETIAADYIC